LAPKLYSANSGIFQRVQKFGMASINDFGIATSLVDMLMGLALPAPEYTDRPRWGQLDSEIEGDSGQRKSR
jgi:hypothetical protein